MIGLIMIKFHKEILSHPNLDFCFPTKSEIITAWKAIMVTDNGSGMATSEGVLCHTNKQWFHNKDFTADIWDSKLNTDTISEYKGNCNGRNEERKKGTKKGTKENLLVVAKRRVKAIEY